MGMNSIEKLGKEVRRVSDELATPEETIARAKRAALAAQGRRSGSWKRPIAVVALAAAMILPIGYAALPARAPAITYSVGSDAAPGMIGAWIAADKESAFVRFSEGTAITLEPGARGRVTRTDSTGATMLIERGHLHAKVVHVAESTSWLVHAGPFDIQVVGTEFDVSWNPASEVLDLQVIEGKVVVRGPLLADGRPIAAREELRVDVQAKKSEVRAKTDESQHSDTQTAQQPDIHPEKPVQTEAPDVSAHAHPDKPVAPPSWRALAAAGRHREAMQAVDHLGFDHLLATSSADVLLELADEARYSGQHARATQALLKARDLGARGRSAFLLGKIAADHENAPADAIAWFDLYLQESSQGGGGLAEQALGRIVELEDRLGHTARARSAGKLYLQRHPGGAYETLARRVVEP